MRATVHRVDEWDPNVLSRLSLLVGCVCVLLLSSTAALSLWLDVGYGRGAVDPWNDLGALQTTIERGLFVSNLRRVLSISAVVVTLIWFALAAGVERSPMALAIAVVIGLASAGWWVGDETLPRSLLEALAAFGAFAIVILRHRRSRRAIVD